MTDHPAAAPAEDARLPENAFRALSPGEALRAGRPRLGASFPR